MGDVSTSNGNHVLNVKEVGDENHNTTQTISSSENNKDSTSCISFPFVQKLIAEVVGTYFVIFAGCASVVVSKTKEGSIVSFPGTAITWGLAVMVMIYSVGHISGAHFNSAVTIAFATTKRFPLKQVPAYVIAQVVGSTLASGTLRLLFRGHQDHFAGTAPQGSDAQAFVLEFIITFYLMFVVSGVATDDRAIGELAGLAIGSTVLLNVMFAGAITGASMNPARSLGPAMVWKEYKGIWIYLVSPTLGAIAGAWIYNIIRFTDKPLREISPKLPLLSWVGLKHKDTSS